MSTSRGALLFVLSILGLSGIACKAIHEEPAVVSKRQVPEISQKSSSTKTIIIIPGETFRITMTRLEAGKFMVRLEHPDRSSSVNYDLKVESDTASDLTYTHSAREVVGKREVIHEIGMSTVWVSILNKKTRQSYACYAMAASDDWDGEKWTAGMTTGCRTYM